MKIAWIQNLDRYIVQLSLLHLLMELLFYNKGWSFYSFPKSVQQTKHFLKLPPTWDPAPSVQTQIEVICQERLCNLLETDDIEDDGTENDFITPFKNHATLRLEFGLQKTASS